MDGYRSAVPPRVVHIAALLANICPTGVPVGVAVAVFVADGVVVGVLVGVLVWPPLTVRLPLVVNAGGSPSFHAKPGWNIWPGSV